MNESLPPFENITRRQLIRRTFAFSAAMLLHQRLPGQQVPARDAPAPDTGRGVAHLIAVGDFGALGSSVVRQEAVASGMKSYLRKNKIKPEALLLLGDNFYGGLDGKGTRSPRWKRQIEDMYPTSHFNCPIHVVLGNHDYSDERELRSRDAQLAYARDHPRTRWSLPSQWYSFGFPEKNPLVGFLALDTNFTYKNEGWVGEEQRRGQMEWFRKEIAKPLETPWRFVMGHHPVYSNGVHGDDARMGRDYGSLFKEHGVDLYLAGHDHDLQHIEAENHPTSFVVSGGGGARVRDLKNTERGPFSQAVYGFTHVEVTAGHFILRHIDANGKLLHAFRKSRDGEVEIL